MKILQIGELNFEKFKTKISITEDLKKTFKSNKISLTSLIPVAQIWYDSELLELIDENGDGKPDEKFGKDFNIIYFLEKEKTTYLEQEVLNFSKISIKNIKLKYAIMKCQK